MEDQTRGSSMTGQQQTSLAKKLILMSSHLSNYLSLLPFTVQEDHPATLTSIATYPSSSLAVQTSWYNFYWAPNVRGWHLTKLYVRHL